MKKVFCLKLHKNDIGTRTFYFFFFFLYLFLLSLIYLVFLHYFFLAYLFSVLLTFSFFSFSVSFSISLCPFLPFSLSLSLFPSTLSCFSIFTFFFFKLISQLVDSLHKCGCLLKLDATSPPRSFDQAEKILFSFDIQIRI